MHNRKRHVADVALTLFLERGVQQTSIQEIIDRANISKGTFYNYFSSKTECIAAVLELLRYEARERRLTAEVGKNTANKELLVEQISDLIEINEERNLHVLFEGLLHSNEPELKKLVLQHRLIEIRWVCQRIVDVYGFEYESVAYEAAVMMHGLLQHMLFMIRVTNSAYTLKELVATIFHYIELLLPNMSQRFINTANVTMLEERIERPNVTKASLLNMGTALLEEPLSLEQRELIQAIVEELQKDVQRFAVIQALLPAISPSFLETALEGQVKRFVNAVWYYSKSK